MSNSPLDVDAFIPFSLVHSYPSKWPSVPLEKDWEIAAFHTCQLLQCPSSRGPSLFFSRGLPGEKGDSGLETRQRIIAFNWSDSHQLLDHPSLISFTATNWLSSQSPLLVPVVVG